MGWKGTVRSLKASARRSERNAHRRQRDLERQSKEYARMEALEQAAYEVDVYENHLEVLLSMHKECGETINWGRLLSKLEPKSPQKNDRFEQEAVQDVRDYRPGFWSRLFKLDARQRAVLQLKVEAGQAEDRNRYQAALTEWENTHSEWMQERDLAKRILDGDRQAKLDAIEVFEPFTEISLLGSAIQMTVHEHAILESRLSIHGSDVIPTEIKSLLKSGKLSAKAMPIGRFNDLHQDYVCSCALRVGRELLAVLPDDLVIVTAMDNVLNGATGHMQELPILSVAFSRSTMDALNLDAIDPSDAMKNFVHNMSFKKTLGFAPVAVLDAARFSVGA
ncbi:hypothetical protein B7453_19750 [Pseudomonas sp. IB20]|uniref:Uncharacterized protein n=2 Tax=Pseudomonas TaxID=286 RepID=A0ABX7JQH2_9PSED|nr:hypothetical protein [Pseudomonas hygromyciniae]MBN0979737.1 hypothetical protein [Pseudomonas hygromyciniae]OZO02765.1 hypothetical protein B7453_19750 [Pseudomonas sp. IB20]QSB37625.1 hypothetical protein JTY93_14800 [Pseudomonas hygromyciniae]UXZ24871.1 hypothetical protein KZH41_11945 [Pseudomonas sp. YeP6b]